MDAAPEPQEVIWCNVGLRQWERSARRSTLIACFLLLLVTYVFPVSAIQGLLQVCVVPYDCRPFSKSDVTSQIQDVKPDVTSISRT